MPMIEDEELARAMYLVAQAVEAARDVEGDASDRIEIALTEVLKVLRLVEARRGGQRFH